MMAAGVRLSSVFLCLGLLGETAALGAGDASPTKMDLKYFCTGSSQYSAVVPAASLCGSVLTGWLRFQLRFLVATTAPPLSLRWELPELVPRFVRVRIDPSGDSPWLGLGRSSAMAATMMELRQPFRLLHFTEVMVSMSCEVLL